MSLARYARHTQTPLVLLTGGSLSPAEWEASLRVNGEWSLAESLLVVVAERIDLVRYMVQTRWSERTARITKPFHMPRPGESAVETEAASSGARVASFRELAQILGGPRGGEQ